MSIALDTPDRDVGAIVYQLLASPHEWVSRRVESVQFLGADLVRRRVSVAFVIPGATASSDREKPVIAPIPLVLRDKSFLTSVSVWDESGAALPVFTRSECAFVAWSALVAGAESLNGATVSEDLQAELRLVAGEVKGPDLLDELRSSSASNSPREKAGLELQALQAGENGGGLSRVTNDLAYNYLLLMQVGDTPGTRRIITVTFDVHSERQQRERLSLGLGFRPTEYRFDVPSVGDAASFHFELETPVELVHAGARLEVNSVEGERETREIDKSNPRLHLHATCPGGAPCGPVRVGLRPPRQGFLRAVFFTGVFVTVLLALGALFSKRVSDTRAEAALALLLAVPGTVIAFISRPGEHEVASRVLVGVRALVLVQSLLLYAAAITVATGVSGWALQGIWAGLALVSAVCSFLLWLTWFRAPSILDRQVDRLPAHLSSASSNPDGARQRPRNVYSVRSIEAERRRDSAR
jgi:hypothetical protein